MRLLPAAIVLSLIAVSASAQMMRSALSPALRPSPRLFLKQPPHVGPAPVRYSLQQRASAVQRLMNLNYTPTLSQTITLTPTNPLVPGAAELDYNNVSVWSGNFDNLVPAGGETEVHNALSGYIRIKFNARAGQRYVFDCRADPSTAPVTYNVYSSAPDQTGTISIGQDGHFIFIMYQTPTDQVPIVILSQAVQNPATWLFYGCDISPF